MSRKNDSLLFASGVVLGAAVGGALGLLFAPASGEETRKNLAKKGKKAMKDIESKAKVVGKKIEPAIEEVKERAEDLKRGFRKGVRAAKK